MGNGVYSWSARNSSLCSIFLFLTLFPLLLRGVSMGCSSSRNTYMFPLWAVEESLLQSLKHSFPLLLLWTWCSLCCFSLFPALSWHFLSFLKHFFPEVLLAWLRVSDVSVGAGWNQWCPAWDFSGFFSQRPPLQSALLPTPSYSVTAWPRLASHRTISLSLIIPPLFPEERLKKRKKKGLWGLCWV